ncbi:Putative palmitoyltransferase, DHHC domain-containing protein [Septoria linicola]|uniref:Palmitoyltransferase n=1 Tax=Septoria linicola TaxID=215465 RepID=A0A9Q9EHU5_9PEZI|nr:putative palmitoyltransferase, DHHC domain-containing protein [Septoria linicola]USW52171.1 Putative palmitoyltransferase, DHHC domain-containing protein [Septoria linicola]
MAPTNRVSVGTARVIPVLLVLIVGYASYVIIGPLCINYLINPPEEKPRRLVTAIALIAVYFVLLIPVATSWLRLLLAVLLDPGYVPRGSDDQQYPTIAQPQPGLEEFWTRDVFVCDINGLPIWCDYCKAWKRDRTHHNQDVGRCTRKMDHFCPWVGGVVGERSFNFFVQFLFYTMVFTAYCTGVLGYFVAEWKHNVHWFVALGLAGFFLLFTSGMVTNSLNMTFKNITTIESVRGKMYLAVILPPEMQRDPLAPPPPARLARSPGDGESEHSSERPLTSELDHPEHINYFKRQPRTPSRNSASKSPPSPSKLFKGTVTYPLQLPTDRPPIPAPEPRTFAILETPRGLNPWDLGSAYHNFQAVFGRHFYEWLLPLRHSPCCNHESIISEYPLGPEFEVLLVDAGLIRPARSSSRKRERRPSSTHSRRRKRRLDAGWQDGERPNGWVSEKEARRIRNEWRRRVKQVDLLQGSAQQPADVH